MATTNMNDGFNVSIVKASRELTRREKLNYTSLCIEDSSGERYYSGSESLMSSFLNIWETMADDNGNPAEEYQIEIRQIPSSNRDGQFFLKAFII